MYAWEIECCWNVWSFSVTRTCLHAWHERRKRTQSWINMEHSHFRRHPWRPSPQGSPSSRKEAFPNIKTFRRSSIGHRHRRVDFKIDSPQQASPGQDPNGEGTNNKRIKFSRWKNNCSDVRFQLREQTTWFSYWCYSRRT